MKTSWRVFLALTLSLLLLGLAAHSVPAIPTCACVNNLNESNTSFGLEACLVCQLQTGVCITANLSDLPDNIPAGGKNPFRPSPLKHAAEISHPPILF